MSPGIRCFLCLTTALRMKLGGGLHGPAGEGKTETVKELARTLGAPCFVFQGSDQTTHRTTDAIFRGMAQVNSVSFFFFEFMLLFRCDCFGRSEPGRFWWIAISSQQGSSPCSRISSNVYLMLLHICRTLSTVPKSSPLHPMVVLQKRYFS